MKKIILTVAAVFAFGFANAQEEVKEKSEAAYGFAEGDMFIEGAIRFTTGDTKDDVFTITPKFGYLLSDKLAVGGALNFETTKYDGVGDAGFVDGDKRNVFGITGFARYYFLNLAEKRFGAYGEFGLGYSSVKYDYEGGGSETNGDLNANIDLGLNYFITPRLAATFTLANILSYNNASPENGDSTSDFELNINLFNNIFAQPQFGLLYKL